MVRAPVSAVRDLCWVRMAEDDPDMHRLTELERELRKARGKRATNPAPESGQSQLGIAFRLVTELVAAVIVGGAVGWGLDRVFGTSPVLLILFFFAGIAAGFRNVLRAARDMNRRNADKG
jgi:ATP synthase protein I